MTRIFGRNKTNKKGKTMKFIEILAFIKEIIADDNKMAKFREIVADIKELVSDIKDVVGFFKKEQA